MSLQTWQETLINSQQDGPAVGNTTTETTLLNIQEQLIIPGGFWQIGRHMKVAAFGRISNIVTSPGTLTLRLKHGATIIAASPAFALNIVAKTNVSWWLEWVLTCRAIGASGNLMHQGIWTSESVIGSPLPSAGGSGALLIPASAPAVGANFSTAVAQTLDFTAQWSVANAGNTLQCHQYKVISEL